MAIIKLSAIERRRLQAFVTCLVFAVLAWLFTALSNPYKFTVKQPLTFRNSPQKRAFHPLQPDTVNAIVQGTGWQMLFSKWTDTRKEVNVDLQSLDTKNFIVLSSQLKQINAKKDPDREMVGFSPDTLFFDFSNRSVKRVPVQAVTSLQFERQFAQSGVMTIKPAYVKISGPAEVLARINFWKTDSLKLTDLNESVNRRISLKRSNEGNLDVEPKAVSINIPVDEFTEKTIEVPVKLINNRNFYDVKVFPQKIKIIFTTSLRDYPDMNEDDFEAVADLDLWSRQGYTTLPVKITNMPSYSKIVKMVPQNVDFIVKK
ncbi:YbbR-like domain-containing protein [Mucilaginibacter terrenus]|uniref:YbbR-like domain-containing protein n=1 Tax=Mucilaginibacter terrenus TaxID=2482727 RepID=A0A3E2NX99_9SPHI|nr:YbbR-like domain-containing protein [Mucilaginibacter terrenus]RFZ85569.1 YbbR-like domain-containing protein [Mucilaginibacter terrenus]